jgi:hypothetical protein
MGNFGGIEDAKTKQARQSFTKGVYQVELVRAIQGNRKPGGEVFFAADFKILHSEPLKNDSSARADKPSPATLPAGEEASVYFEKGKFPSYFLEDVKTLLVAAVEGKELTGAAAVINEANIAKWTSDAQPLTGSVFYAKVLGNWATSKKTGEEKEYPKVYFLKPSEVDGEEEAA